MRKLLSIIFLIGACLTASADTHTNYQASFSTISGSATCAQLPALTGDVTTSAGTCGTTVSAIQGTAVSGVTGTGSAVLSNSPSLTTPNIGAATATSVNGNIFTTGSSTYTGTAGKTYTFPITSASIARTDAAQTFTGTQTFGNIVATGTISNAATAGTSISTGLDFVAGNATSGQGGNFRSINDAGTLQWTVGILGSAGATSWDLFDNVNGASRIDVSASTGKIGLGTTASTAQLKVQVAATGTSLSLSDGVNSTLSISHPSSGVVNFADGGGNNFLIDTSGAVTIATGKAVLMPGLASSSAATTGTVCWTTATGNLTVDTTLACLASTIKVKQMIKWLSGSLDTVMKLRPVSYFLKPEFNPEHLGEQVGLIAEDVQKIEPRLVGLHPDGSVAGVRYMQLTAVLVGAIQEQQHQIDILWCVVSLLGVGLISLYAKIFLKK